MNKALERSHQALHSFCIRPSVKFESQANDEEVLLVLRAHPITQIPWIVNGIIFIVILIFLDFVFLGSLKVNQGFFINFLGIVFILSYLWFNFLGYFFNVGIVTDMRVIDIDFNAVIYKEFTDASLSKIEDITAKSGGYFASIFDYGNIFTQTAGTEVNIEFLKVPKPSQVVSIINSLTRSE